ncbi:FAD-dependent monooxygenase [Larsenimonas salina]|uniref:FAD-dependent monooxygenase n=1 Tax=Larsenimonas salina TaxID=1295565 RepID=UPI002073A3BB|nr:FAD-dependent monooxygenase [Larsenimonas salina]MCM5703613.1 FAD-dependent monooxygenase [Larsenimonas salina]
MTHTRYDVAIIGGGMTGAALAQALADTDLTIALIEPAPPAAFDPAAAPDLRISSLNQSSCTFLERLGVLEAIKAKRAHPFVRLSVWEELEGERLARRRWNQATFDARDIQHDQLGYMVENRVIQRTLWDALEHRSNVGIHAPARLETLTLDPDGVRITLNDGTHFEASLVVGAEGARSSVRTAANIEVDTRPYGHKAMIVNVLLDAPPLDITWQAFTPSGPHALLPLFKADEHGHQSYASLVWYDAPERIDTLSALSMDALKAELETTFPGELPAVNQVLGCGSFPLVRQHATRYVQDRVALIGDAAHVINPLAGQGVNLGFQDVEALSALIHSAHSAGKPYWAQHVLNEYALKRQFANRVMMSAMDVFYHGFKHQALPLKLLRNAGLALAERAGPGKRKVMAYAMGLSRP